MNLALDSYLISLCFDVFFRVSD